MSIHQYFDALPKALLAFQHLEVMLQFYIRDCDRIIQKAVKESFHYSVREKDIEKLPLGRLIDEFTRRSNRKDIISVLRTLNKHRNFIAHSAYLVTIEDQEDSDKMSKLSSKIVRVTEAVNACLKEIYCELSKVKKEPVSQDILDSFKT